MGFSFGAVVKGFRLSMSGGLCMRASFPLCRRKYCPEASVCFISARFRKLLLRVWIRFSSSLFVLSAGSMFALFSAAGHLAAQTGAYLTALVTELIGTTIGAFCLLAWMCGLIEFRLLPDVGYCSFGDSGLDLPVSCVFFVSFPISSLAFPLCPSQA